jgi:hypothetical protein
MILHRSLTLRKMLLVSHNKLLNSAKILEHLSLPITNHGHRSYRQLEKHVQNLLKAKEAIWYKH